MRVSPALAVMIGALIAVPGSAAANSQTDTSTKVSSATASVSSCGSLAGLTVSWTSTNNVVTAVVVSSIPSACNGAALSLTLVGSGNASLSTLGPVTISGTTQTFSSVTGSPTASSVTGAFASVTGP